MSRTVLPAATLWKREVVRFLRQRNRVMSALVQPVFFWVLFGAGFGKSLRTDAMGGAGNFYEFFFPGTIVMILLFTAIFATVSVIQDRNEGFLQAVLAAPVTRAGIVLGKVGGGATLAFGQGILFLCLAPLVGIAFDPLVFLEALGVMALISFALTALGLIVAWPMDSVQGFHAIMMLVLIPMWLLSGAFFPVSNADSWMSWVMRLNPLTYGVAALRGVLTQSSSGGQGLPGTGVSLLVTAVFAVVAFGIALVVVQRRKEGAK